MQLKEVLRKTDKLLLVPRNDYASISRFINGMIDSLGWGLMVEGRARGTVDNSIRLWHEGHSVFCEVDQRYYHNNSY